MKIDKIFKLALFVSITTLIISCNDNSLPEVNSENCTTEKIKAIPKPQQQEFASKCLRRGDYKRSPARSW